MPFVRYFSSVSFFSRGENNTGAEKIFVLENFSDAGVRTSRDMSAYGRRLFRGKISRFIARDLNCANLKIVL